MNEVTQGLINGLNEMIDSYGTSATHTDISDASTPFKILTVAQSAQDQAIVNQFGAQTRVAVSKSVPEMKQADLITMPNGLELTVLAANEIFIGDTMAGFRLYLKGD